MPLRIAPFRAAAHLVAAADSRTRPPPSNISSFFHSSSALRRDDIDSKNHYETLGVQTGASPKDIKRSFYHLSKTHHPDHNRDDPLASKRFMRISEAYSVLSHTERRAKYDRDVLRLHDQRAAAAGPQHHGSYSSTGPAGGRPASGLSRRRGTFRGPPPSFYRSGGWGAHGAKRSQAQQDSMSGAGGSSSHHDAHQHGQHHHHHRHNHHQQNQQHQSESDAHGFGSSGSGEMPHFDRTAKAAHTRTQGRVDEIRARNAAKKPRFPSASGDYGEVGSFFAVLAVLGVAVGLPYLVMRGWNRPEKKKQKTQA